MFHDTGPTEIEFLDSLHFVSPLKQWDERKIIQVFEDVFDVNGNSDLEKLTLVQISSFGESRGIDSFDTCVYFSEDLFTYINQEIFTKGNTQIISILGECEPHGRNLKAAKFLGLIMLTHQFYGAINLIRTLEKNNFYRLIDKSDYRSKEFMYFHVPHFLNHNEWESFGHVFSLYKSENMLWVSNVESTTNLLLSIADEINTLYKSDYFDECFIPFYEGYARLKGVSPKVLIEELNGTLGALSTPISEKLTKLGFLS